MSERRTSIFPVLDTSTPCVVDVVNFEKGTSIKIVRQGACETDSPFFVQKLELVSEELNHLAAILHVYAGGLIFMK